MARAATYRQGDATEVALRDFAPDLDPTTPGILLDMDGARPTIKGYIAGLSPQEYAPQVPLSGPADAVLGATLSYSTNRDSFLFAGTHAHLFRLDANPTRRGGQWNLADGGQTFVVGPAPAGNWRFFQFGNNLIAVAAGLNVPPQRADLTQALPVFAPLAGVDPATMYDCVTGCSSAGTAFLFKGQTWFASAPGVDTDWTPDVQTLAATGFLYDLPGPITAAAPFYRTVIVWKEQAMWVGSFVGPPFSWSFQLISDQTGCRAQEAVVSLPDSIAFLGTDDFYITTGTIPIRIPNSLKEWFFDHADPAQLGRVQGWYDNDSAIVTWHFCSLAPPFPTVPDMYVSYNVRAKRWAKGTRNVSIVPQPNNVTPISDAEIFFDETSTPMSLTGPPENMTLRTGWLGSEGLLTSLMRVRAKYNVYPASQQLMAYHTNILQQVPPNPALTVPALGADDWFNLRQTDRWHQVLLSTTGAAEITALAYEARPAGIR